MRQQVTGRRTGKTLYSVIMAALIEWAGRDADIDDIRDVARTLTPVVRDYRMPNRDLIAAALKGHRLDLLNQDSGYHCICRSDSRFEQADGDHPWSSINEHRADMVIRALVSGNEDV